MNVWGLESERHSAGDCLITVVLRRSKSKGAE